MQNRQSRAHSHFSPSVHLKLLGPFQMRVDGQKASLSARKAKALLAYLAVRLDEEVPRDTLVGLLWSDRGPDQARASLRQSLSSIRSALGSAAEQSLFSTNDFVRLASETVLVDRRVIIAIPADAPIDSFNDLTTQFHSVFLEGINVNEPEFDYWLSAERAAVQTDKISFLFQLVDRCQKDMRIDDALRYGTQLLTLDPLNEQMHRTLMTLFMGQGRHDAALKQFELCKRELADQLQTHPEQSTLELVAEIKSQRRARVTEPKQLFEKPPEDRAQMGPAKPSVAVLPFTNLSGDIEQDYFSDGITCDIITELSKFRTLFVVAQHSSFAFKGQQIGIQDIAQKLGVQYVIEGSVRRAGTAIRISVQLIEADTGHHIWAERYDRELTDIFAVQDELTRNIVGVLPGRVQDSVADRISRMPTTNMKAYEFMLRGKQLRDNLDAESTAKARTMMEKALTLDPNYARAYMYLADTYVVDLWLGLADSDASHKSLQLSRKGAGLDNNDVYIQDQLGFAFLCEGLWDDAELQFTRTLARIVNEAESMAWCGYGFLLLGHEEKALEVVSEAMRLDPLHAPAANWILGQIHFFSGNYTGAIRALIGEALLNSLAHAFLASSYAHLGKLNEAQNALNNFVRIRRKELISRGRVQDDETIAGLAAAYKPMWRKSSNWEHLADGLRKAGLSN